MNQEKGFSLLGLANRARKCISGEELVVKEIQRNNVSIVILSKDASINTRKKITDKCRFYNVPIIEVNDRYVLGQSIGKSARVVVAVTDAGFAKKLRQLLDESFRG